jgi:hypothetical protein
LIRLLFVPVSGSQGSGEYYRSLAIAQAAQRRWPEAAIEFILNLQAGYASQAPYPVHLIDGSPTHNTTAVNQIIDRMRPGVVLFDSSGRQAQLAHARRSGAGTVFISSRFKTRWKGFRLRRMRVLDQHWLAWPQLLGGGLAWHERLKLWLVPRVRVVPLEVIYPPPVPERAAQLQRELGVQAGRYVVVCGGGGGYRRSGRPASEIFAEAALQLGAALEGQPGLDILCVGGPNIALPVARHGPVRMLAALPGEQLIDLLAGARLALVNGGSLLLQAVSLQVPCVAAPIAGDQDGRITLCARHGAVAPTQLNATQMATVAARILGDDHEYQAMRRALQALDLANGIDRALDALAGLLTERGHS